MHWIVFLIAEVLLPKIAILMTTFLRNELANKTIQTILPQLSDDCILLIADQNKPEQQLTLDSNWNHIFYCSLPYDCGLSFVRNYLEPGFLPFLLPGPLVHIPWHDPTRPRLIQRSYQRFPARSSHLSPWTRGRFLVYPHLTIPVPG